MKPCIDMLFSNALLTIPIALAVAVIARWVKRPAAVHALWIIVLLKLFSPQVYNLPVPQIGDLPVPLAAWSSAPSHESAHESVPQTLSNEVRPRESLSSQHNIFWQETVHGFRDSERDARNAIASQPRRAEDENSVPSGALPSPIASRRVSTQPASASLVSTKPVLISSVSLRSICVALWLMGSVIFFAVLGYRVRLFHRFVKTRTDGGCIDAKAGGGNRHALSPLTNSTDSLCRRRLSTVAVGASSVRHDRTANPLVGATFS